ncbi:MAG: MerR family transcriptional regulator [Gammaproteobacteria bacterium]|nr:MerR family transcriptional regulator [Gammaproteobacteria bacterium]
MANKSLREQFVKIPDKTYFTIGEVSDLCGITSSKLRDWEIKFESLLTVQRRGTRRYYTQENIKRIREIRILMEERGFTMKGVLNYWSEVESQELPLNRPLVALELKEALSDLRSLKSALRQKA